MTTVAEVLAETLASAGIDTIFGLPGGENSEVMEALRRRGMAFVLVRNESSALFMADVTARLTGKPAVALATLGPGAANAYAGMAHCYLDRAPVLLITAASDGGTAERHTHQVLDLAAVYEPVSKMTRALTDVHTWQTVQQALRAAMAPRPGPVHLRLSSRMAGREAEEVTSKQEAPPAPPGVPEAAIREAQAFLVRAKRPLIVAGLGLEPQKPYEALRALAEAARAPVVVTPKAKGALPDDHPLAAGVIGLTDSDPAYRLVEASDCIVAAGFDVVELVRPWNHPQPMLWVAPWKNEDPVLPTVRQEMVGAMGPILQQLSQTTFRTAPDWSAARVAALRPEPEAAPLPAPAPGRLLPQTMLEALRHNVPRETVVTTDVGSHKILAGLRWPTYTPNSYLLSNGLSSMGFGLPAAIAAARVTQAPVLCITGDGGLAMALGELGLLRELTLPVLVVVINDNALDLIRSAQLRRGYPAYGTEFENPDYEAIAAGFDLAFHRVRDEVGCEAAIRQAMASGRPALIEALIDPIGYPTTPR